MEKTISQLLDGLRKPSRSFRPITVRISESEFAELRSYAATRYLNYSDVLRAGLALLLTTPTTPEETPVA